MPPGDVARPMERSTPGDPAPSVKWLFDHIEPLRQDMFARAVVAFLALPGMVALTFHLRVVLGEESWLARTYGNEWQDYARRVPRWFF